MKCISASLATLVALTTAQVPTFELLDTFTGLADLGGFSESCEYDSVNDKWRLFNWLTTTPYSLPASYPQTDLVDGDFVTLSAATALNIRGVNAQQFVAGSPNYIYLATASPLPLGLPYVDGTSRIVRYNVDDESYQSVDAEYNVVELPGVDGDGDAANGLCYDADNEVLYVTSVGVDFFVEPNAPVANANYVYKVENIGSSVPVTATAIDLSTLVDADGNAVTDRTLYPNGCTVADGKVWLVDAVLGGLGVYEIDTEVLTLRADMLSEDAFKDGIIAIENFLVVSTSAFNGSLLWYDMEQYPSGSFEVGILNIVGTGDIGYDPATGVICAPQVNFEGGGVVQFFQFTAPTARPTTAFPTVVPTAAPVTTTTNIISVTVEGGPTFEYLDTFTGLANLGGFSESCEHDAQNNKWHLFNWYTTTPYTLPGSYPLTDLADGDFVTLSGVAASNIRGVNAQEFVAGSPNYIYVATASTLPLAGFGFSDVDGISRIVRYNVDADSFDVLVELPGVDGDGDMANGLCYDADNEVLFVTSVGANYWVTPYAPVANANFLYKVENIGSADTATATAIDLSTVVDADGNAVTSRTLYPNGCTVADGKVWLVDAVLGGLGVYEIDTGVFTLRADLLDEGANGIIAIDNFLVVSVLTGSLLWYDMGEYPSGSFAVGISGLTGTGDIGFDRSSNVICIPEVNFETGAVVQFVQFNFPVATTTTTEGSAGGSGVSRVFCCLWVVLGAAFAFLL